MSTKGKIYLGDILVSNPPEGSIDITENGTIDVADYETAVVDVPKGLPDWLKDGDTHLWLYIIHSCQLAQELRIRMIGTIDWGDGTTTTANVTTYTTFSHTYAAPGRYRIDLHPTSGTFYLGGAASSYNVMGERSVREGGSRYDAISALYQIEIGSSIINTISNYSFYYMKGLERIYIPDNIHSIGTYVFCGCSNLYEIEVEDASKLTSVGANYLFTYCYRLISTGGIVQTTAAMTYAYRECYSLQEVTIPANVTSIGTYQFYSDFCLKYIHMLPTTPPTVSNANCFTSLNPNCIIEVPAASLSAYQSATNWTGVADQMVGV